MKRISVLLVAALMTVWVLGQEKVNPKREMRATWLTTVVNIDWPLSTTKGEAAQKKELTTMLDACVKFKMNTVMFHIRPACDALYKSSYEPWSSYLNNGRGVDPGWDPLQFCIEECHKRGMACHGWINPYRYNNRGGSDSNHRDWTGNNDTTKLNYKHTHPEWLLYYKSDIVLDPALPEVREQIKKVVGDIINNYDLDGLLMDDYFYPYGGTSNQDAASVAKYKPADMNVGDWRRQNVNMMIKEVYDTIQAVKPWVTFGVSPFGIWTTDSSVARKRGITLPSGISGGNMYAEIYCDPVAWLEEGTVDYISPQLYWKIGGGQDYKKLSRWWANLCNRFGKHFYSSMALYKYEDGTFDATEIRNQSVYNRVVTDNAPGAIWYNTRAWCNSAKLRVNITKEGAEFHDLALPPAINWKPTKERTMVENLTISGQKLSWTHAEANELHFAIYAVPNDSASNEHVYSRSDMLVGVSYTTEFALPAEVSTSTHKIAVSVLDKYNNEYALRVMGENLREAVAAKNLVPATGANKALPFRFRWDAVAGADSYIIQFAKDADMQQIVFAQELTETSFVTTNRLNLDYLPLGEYYWRVKTRIPNAGDTWSEVQKITLSLEDAVENIVVDKEGTAKWIEDGQVYIEHEGVTYNMQGNIVK